MAITTLSSSNETKKARLKNGDKVPVRPGPASVCYGLLPVVFEEEIDFKFLPGERSPQYVLSARGIKGFSLGMVKGIDLVLRPEKAWRFILRRTSLRRSRAGHRVDA